jgi:hypothetical protein
VGNGETKIKYRYEKIQVENGGYVAQGILQAKNPWTGKGVRVPTFPWN